MRTLKKIALLIFIVSLFHNFTYSQWQTQVSGLSSTINDVQVIGLNDVYAVADNSVFLKTSNGGTNWNITTLPVAADYLTLQFINSSIGYIGGTQGNFLKTTNAGTNWINLTSNLISHGVIFSIFFINTSTGFVGTSGGDIQKTTNGGNNWTEFNTGTTEDIHSVFFLNASTGFFGSSGNTSSGRQIKRTTNGGTNWITVLNDFNPINSLVMCDASTGFASATAEIYKTTNGGINWSGTNPGITGVFNKIQMSSALSGYVCGSQGKIIKTTNGGINWGQQVSGVTTSLKGIYQNLVFTTLCWTVGNNGVILKTTNGGGNFITAVEPQNNLIPGSFSLEQNYPNPFNPETNINFAIPPSFINNGLQPLVRLVVYDILGNEIAVLVNENLSTGNYSINFNASSLPSGTYFYRLTSGTFTDTKKLILIK